MNSFLIAISTVQSIKNRKNRWHSVAVFGLHFAKCCRGIHPRSGYDELTFALDSELVGEVLNVIGELADERCTIIVAHEMRFSVMFPEKSFSRKKKLLLKKEGRISFFTTLKIRSADNLFHIRCRTEILLRTGHS
ncbi:hypothetical protein [Bartonella sp. CB169]|uniref:hypothetical protein n=1 Tax=Bartonella sp. CB169 TaxID=3112257 RepID=UPI00300DC7A2